jgi:hypothetical protein
MASNFTTDPDTGAVVIRGIHFSGLAKCCKTEAEAKAYIARRRDKDKWAAFAIICRPSRHGVYDVVVRQR